MIEPASDSTSLGSHCCHSFRFHVIQISLWPLATDPLLFFPKSTPYSIGGTILQTAVGVLMGIRPLSCCLRSRGVCKLWIRHVCIRCGSPMAERLRECTQPHQSASGRLRTGLLLVIPRPLVQCGKGTGLVHLAFEPNNNIVCDKGFGCLGDGRSEGNSPAAQVLYT